MIQRKSVVTKTENSRQRDRSGERDEPSRRGLKRRQRAIITERTGGRAETTAVTSPDRILDALPEAIVCFDRDGVVLRANPEAERLLGGESKDGSAAGLRIPELARLANVGASSGRVKLPDENGPPRMLEALVRPLDQQHAEFVAVLREATEHDAPADRGETELELAVGRARNEFLMRMSHELRTPMNAIIGMIELSLGDEHLADRFRELLKTARESAQMLRSLLDDVLDLARMQAGDFELEPRPFELRRALAGPERVLRSRARERGLEFDWTIGDDVPDRLFGDAQRLRQIVMNLAGNAISFTEAGRVRVAIEQTGRKGEDAVLTLSVCDTGAAFAERDPGDTVLSSGHAESSQKSPLPGPGTALGLVICRELVARMRGRLTITDGTDGGCRFTCELPMRTLTAAREAAPESLRVLVVDDDDEHRDHVVQLLRNWSMEPVAVRGGWEALDALSTASDHGGAFRLAIINLLTPDLDGLTVLETIRELGIAPRDVVVMSPEGTGSELVERCLELGVDLMVEKPLKPRSLQLMLQSVLRQSESDWRSPLRAADAGETLSVLVVDDTPAIQKVLSAMLKRRGHQTETAKDGKEALDQVQEGVYDVVLMDIQMPRMDGVKATRAIRQLDPPASRVPIVAMTAHSMRGDRERCLDAGMDAYLSKPIDADVLMRTVERLAARSREFDMHGDSTDWRVTFSSDRQVLDLEAALRRLDGDHDLLRDVASFYAQDAEPLLREIEQALAVADAEEAGRAAHSLKGLASNFGPACAAAAEAVEHAARERDLRRAGELLPALTAEVERLTAALRTAGVLEDD